MTEEKRDGDAFYCKKCHTRHVIGDCPSQEVSLVEQKKTVPKEKIDIAYSPEKMAKVLGWKLTWVEIHWRDLVKIVAASRASYKSPKDCNDCAKRISLEVSQKYFNYVQPAADQKSPEDAVTRRDCERWAKANGYVKLNEDQTMPPGDSWIADIARANGFRKIKQE